MNEEYEPTIPKGESNGSPEQKLNHESSLDIASASEDAFAINKKRHFGNFAIRHREEMKKLVEGRLLGKGSEGWRNVAEHNLLAGVTADRIAVLAGLPSDEQTELVSVATTHDWDKRLDKEEAREQGTDAETKEGITNIKSDVGVLMRQEDRKKGLIRVTGLDWMDFETWGLKEKILRYVDSSLSSDKEGRADFVDWRQRLSDLRDRNPELDAKAGAEMYGMPLFEKLAQITKQIETELYDVIIREHPELQEKYPLKEMLTSLIIDRVREDIEKISD